MAVLEPAEQDTMPPPKKKQLSEDDKRRKKNLVPGGLLKAELRPGGGESTPSDGDQVIYHCTVRTMEGVGVYSTRKDFGGTGAPIRQVLGKSKMILGLLEGIPTMQKGEVCMFRMKSGMHYGEPDCPVPVSEGFPKDVDLNFEIELIDFGKAKVISEDLGVVKKVIKDGQGWESPRAPYEVKAWISAKTADGRLIWSHVEGEPFFFIFGNSELPKGLEMGIGTMTRREKAMIYVTNQYLTACAVLPQVKGLEEVHFEVELVHFVQVRDVLGDGRLIKRRIRDGEGEFPMDCPLQDSQLCVHYKGMLLDDKKTVFYDTRIDNDGQPLEFCSGEGLVPEGFEMSVRLMLPGELALVTCPPDYAYDKFPRPANVPEGAYVEWEIELLNFEMPKDWTGLDFRGIMAEAENIRSTGNRLFKEGKYGLAKAKYEKVLRDFNHVNPQDDEEGKEFLNARNMLHLNVAACYLKMGECRKSIETCDKVLDANPVHVKALYRRGMAYMELGEFEEAKNNFDKMMKLDKSSESDAKAALQKLKQREQETARKAKQQFKGLFDKRPGEIAEVSTERAEQVTDGNSCENNNDNEDSSKAKSDEKHVVAPKRSLGLIISLSFIVFLVFFVLFLLYGGELLGISSLPDAMPLHDIDEL
ncbi:peptidyl-prolyl cis-trans isomerase PASTICCINO1-like [Chenopodium quinoa]|uniref:peptidyl-prolyl cis-trans isomerase PASTICCINO1-like n=1 Tax=Chenopodium quinoa TaxID=63459 RepID=UPI000B770F1B|nr:peptidyl-prolyl cis-trans isomerase PASTICCINO1-like [Chenopodium quinoa]